MLVKDNSVTIEESPVVLQYNETAGGRPAWATATHIRNNLEMVLIAHKNRSDGQECGVVHERVTMDDVSGAKLGRDDGAWQIMKDLTLPNGAPNGGVRCALPKQMVQFLVNR